MAALYGTPKRKLYARIEAQGDTAKSHKTAFRREYGISSRVLNAIAVELQGPRAVAWRSVHTAYRGVVREPSLVAAVTPCPLCRDTATHTLRREYAFAQVLRERVEDLPRCTVLGSSDKA
ncbi:hypothetical protein [Paraburkholderia terrae]|uniref:Uncharacterized protein n=1 Tax=Paraburkholderia terrae TaxID=311230 RepID=A0A2I8F253_9BURK|nr:hypothetical protein [Paraburkholderia terrae]AUT65094.1 hypothetical protein C2L65_36575 [Paraburkholderia terrae]